jgi:type IV secretory pathway VirB2 component (pilin)
MASPSVSVAAGTPAGEAISTPVAGVIAGAIAGAAYLAAQVAFTGLAHSGGAAEPLQRIAAILLGPDAAPPPAELNFTVFGMAVLIHFGLAMAYGRLLAELVWRRTLPVAAGIGAAIGLALFVLNFEVIAPGAFPWFEESVRATTLADHMLFGALAAVVCVLLRRRVRTGG